MVDLQSEVGVENLNVLIARLRRFGEIQFPYHTKNLIIITKNLSNAFTLKSREGKNR